MIGRQPRRPFQPGSCRHTVTQGPLLQDTAGGAAAAGLADDHAVEVLVVAEIAFAVLG
ncbi:MAG: hypothetical protein MZV65_37125 [Chromatiales bacterium]|nr:hypothetical protein [Chromatiales bacterium]